MRTLRVALAQMNSVVGDLAGNAQKILDIMSEARACGVDIIAFPEMAITGYPAEDLLFHRSFLRDNLKAMERVVQASQGLTVIVGYADFDENVYNAAAIANDGQLVGVYRKMFLPTYGVFDEDRYFRRGQACPVYTIAGVNVGVNICEDAWYAEGPVAMQAKAGAEVVVNISASPYSMDKQKNRETIVSSRARENGVYFAYVNVIGGQDELVFDGASTVFDPSGRLIARGKEFEEDLVTVDLQINAQAQRPTPSTSSPTDASVALSDGNASTPILVSGFVERERPPLDPPVTHARLEGAAEVYRALVIGTGDYVRKNGFTKVVIGLSGGIDSALTACVGSDALGPDNVKVLAMPSRYSSEGSVVDAHLLARNLGVEILTIRIEEAHQAMLDMLAEPFEGTESGVAEENLQARIRGNLLMAVSNKFGWLVLSTGNKSEMAMGYATLYGDMAGGFAVLKDVPKTLVYDLARWRNENGNPASVIPQATIDKPPSAELKPDQKDEDTLPPYAILDGIIKAYVEEDRSYQEIVAMGYDSQVVRQVMAAVDRNEYKRRQAPPGVKITPKAFGKDRRLPVVNRYRQF